MKLLRKFAVVLTLVYVLVCGLVYWFQESLIFHPRVIPEAEAFTWGEERKVIAEDGTSLSTVWVRKPNAKGVVLYFHGNVGDNNRGRYQLGKVLDQPYDVVAFDYRGFGKSEGYPSSDEQLLSDADMVYQEVKKVYPEDKIFLLGYSLGSGMATYLAAKYKPAHLTLVAPYTSLVDMKNLAFWWVPDAFMKYKLDSESRMAHVKSPVSIYHGTADRLIPFSMAKRLASLLPEHQVSLFSQKGGSHRGAILNIGLEWLP